MNIGAKTLNKILANRTQQKSSYIMINLGLFKECKDSSVYTNQSMCYTILKKLKDKNSIIILIDR